MKRASKGGSAGLALRQVPQPLGVHAWWRAARLCPVHRRPQSDRRRGDPEHGLRDRGHRGGTVQPGPHADPRGRALAQPAPHLGRHLDCSGGDRVADTPNCEGPNGGKPTFPKISCSNGPNGDMFMNYMDYIDDAAMFMFTAGQVSRMSVCLAGPRKSFLGGVGVHGERPGERALGARPRGGHRGRDGLPSRGHRPASVSRPDGFRARADGTFAEAGLGATDVPEEATGSWALEDETITLSKGASQGVPREMRVVTADKERLVVRKAR